MSTEGTPVLYRDAELLALDKPAWLATTSPRVTGAEDTLAARARRLAPDAEIVHPTSRLDVGVTGVVVFALARSANALVLEARARGEYRRTYVALLGDADLPSSGEWTRTVAVHPDDPKRRVAIDHADTRALRRARRPEPAFTQFMVVSRCGAGVSLVVLRPRTGRTHQLRVHASAAGAPILGDSAYGGARRVTLADGRVVAFARPMLHCARVRIAGAHGDGSALDVRSSPADLVDAWDRLGGAPVAWASIIG